MRAVTGFTQRGNWGDGLHGVSNAEHPGRGCRVRERGSVGEGVGGRGEERRCDGGGRESLLGCGRGGARGGREGEEAVRSQGHLPEERKKMF